MEAKDDYKHGVSIDTTYKFDENTKVSGNIVEIRQFIQSRLQNSFDSLPETKHAQTTLDKYIKNNPQSVVFIPHKDVNMFAIVVEEAKTMAKSYYKEDKLDKRLNQILDHEFDHVRKCYELGVDFKGMGLVLFKRKNKPVFGAFVSIPDVNELSLKDNLRIYLAPKTRIGDNTGDYIKSGQLFFNSLKNAKTFSEVDQIMSDTIFVMNERYFPGDVKMTFK